MADLSESISNLIDNLYTQLNNKDNDIQSLNKKYTDTKSEYNKILLKYAEAVYELIGNLNKESLTPPEICSINKCKAIIDSCISSNSLKDYLTERFINHTTGLIILGRDEYEKLSAKSWEDFVSKEDDSGSGLYRFI